MTDPWGIEGNGATATNCLQGQLGSGQVLSSIFSNLGAFSFLYLGLSFWSSFASVLPCFVAAVNYSKGQTWAPWWPPCALLMQSSRTQAPLAEGAVFLRVVAASHCPTDINTGCIFGSWPCGLALLKQMLSSYSLPF